MTGSATPTLSADTRVRRRLPAAVRLAALIALLGNSADTFLLFLLLWLAQPQGWSPTQIALVVLTLRLPVLASGVLIGRCIDRWGARRLILLDTAARAALLVALAASVRSGTVPLPAVFVLGGLAGVSSPATYAGVRWLVPRITPAGQLTRANATVAVGDQLPLLVGTALVGPSVALLGVRGSLCLAAGMLGCAFLVALGLPRLGPAGAGAAVDRLATESRAADRLRSPRVVAIIALSTVYYLVYGPFETASPGFVREQLSGVGGTYSLLWGLFGAGALLSLPLAPWLARRRPGLVNAVGAVAWGLVMAPLVFLESVPAAAVVFVLGGLVWGPYTSVETTALQRWVDPARHGRVFGVQRSLLAAAAPVGAALGALALDVASPGAVLLVSALCCAGAGVVALLHGDLRRAR